MKNKILIRLILAVFIIVIILLGIYILMMNNKDNHINDNKINLTITSPVSTPSFNIALLENNDKIHLQYKLVNGTDGLVSAFLNESSNLIVAPIDLGLKMIEKNSDYRLLSVVSWGNLYIVSNGKDSNTLAAFGEGSLPSFILNYNKEYLDNYDIKYYPSASEVASLFLAGKVDNALLSEPLLTKVLSQKENYKIAYDMQKLYKKNSGTVKYPQAAIFVHNDLLLNDKDKIMTLGDEIIRIEKELSKDIDNLDHYLIDVDLEEFGLPDIDLLKKAYKKMNLKYEYIFNCLDDVVKGLELFDISLNSSSYIK